MQRLLVDSPCVIYMTRAAGMVLSTAFFYVRQGIKNAPALAFLSVAVWTPEILLRYRQYFTVYGCRWRLVTFLRVRRAPSRMPLIIIRRWFQHLRSCLSVVCGVVMSDNGVPKPPLKLGNPTKVKEPPRKSGAGGGRRREWNGYIRR